MMQNYELPGDAESKQPNQPEQPIANGRSMWLSKRREQPQVSNSQLISCAPKESWFLNRPSTLRLLSTQLASSSTRSPLSVHDVVVLGRRLICSQRVPLMLKV